MHTEMVIEDHDAVHGDHQEVAMGEIQHPHDAEDKRQGHCNQRVNAA